MHYRISGYAKRARKRFCTGVRGQSPADLVLSGKRTLEEWVEVLNEERQRQPRSKTPVNPRDDFEWK